MKEIIEIWLTKEEAKKQIPNFEKRYEIKIGDYFIFYKINNKEENTINKGFFFNIYEAEIFLKKLKEK